MQKPNRSFAKKVFAAGLAISTVMWAAGAFLVLPVAADSAHPAGTLVLSGGTVWRINDSASGRNGIDSMEKFESNRFSWSNIVPANAADLALPDQGLQSWGDGVLFNDGGTVYQVSGGMKHGFTSASNFTGNGFSFANVVSGNLSSVPAGGVIGDTSSAHLAGTFVVSGGTVWYIDATGRMGVPSPGVLWSWGATFADVVPANAADLALANEGNATYRTGTLVNDSGTIYDVTATTKAGFPSASCFTGFGFNFSMPVSGSTSGLTAVANLCSSSTTPTPTPTPTPSTSSTGNLSVSLASDTPAAATVVKNAARVPFTKVNLTASGGNVVVSQLLLQRMGISTDANFSSVILLDVSANTSVGMANQIGNEKSLNTNHQAAFNDAITVFSGTTKSIMLAGNMATALNASDQVQLAVVGMTLSGSATLSASFPIMGNTMTMNSNVAIATVTVASGGQNPSATTQNVGTSAYVVTSFKMTNNSGTDDVQVSHIRFYNNGTSADNDVANLKLYVDGNVVATASQLTNKEAVFNLSSPILIARGSNKDFNLSLDIVSGSGRNIELDVDKQADIVVQDMTYNFYILPTYPNTTSPFFSNASNITTISKGSITFSKGVLANLNIASGVNNQPIGAFKTTVQGEPVQVTQLILGATFSGTGANATNITNFTIVDPAGYVIGGPVSASTTTNTATDTDTIIFPVGTNTYTINANLNSSVTSASTIQMRLSTPSSLATSKGTVTNQSITAGPTSDVSLDTASVQAAALKVSTSATPGAQSVIVGASGFTLANFILDAANSGEDVRVTQFNVVIKTSANSIQTNVANLTLYNGSTQLLPIVQPVAAAATTATSTISLTNPVIVAKNSQVTLTLKGDFVTGSNPQTISFGLNGSAAVVATGAVTASSVTAGVTNNDGAVMTIVASGTMTVAADASSPSQGQLLSGGQSKVDVGDLLITSNNEDLDLQNINFVVNTASTGGTLTTQVATVYLFDGSTQIASVVPTSTTAVTFQGLQGKFVIPKGGSKKLGIKVDTNLVTNNNGDGNVAVSGQGIIFTVAEDDYNAKGVSSGSLLSAANKSGTFTGQQFQDFKSVPTWSVVSLSSTTLANQSGLTLYQFKVTADPKGDLGFYKASFQVTTSTPSGTLTIGSYKFYENPGTSNQVDLTTDGARAFTTMASDSVANVKLLFSTSAQTTTNGGQFRFVPAGTSNTYQLQATVSGSVSGSSVSTVQLGDSAFTAVYPNAAGGATTGNNTSTGISGQSATTNNFIWSDLAYGNSSSTATDTQEWFNGFRVSGMNPTSASVTVSR